MVFLLSGEQFRSEAVGPGSCKWRETRTLQRVLVIGGHCVLEKSHSRLGKVIRRGVLAAHGFVLRCELVGLAPAS